MYILYFILIYSTIIYKCIIFSQVVSPSNWLQLSSLKQSVFGIASYPYFDGASTNQNYYIRASDNEGNHINASLNVIIDTENLVSVSHVFLMTITTDLYLFTRDSSHIVWWAGNVTKFFNSDISDITILNVTAPLVTVMWSNNSIQSAYTCPIASIRDLYQTVSSDQFIQSLPQFFITSISLKLVGICSEFSVEPTVETTTTTTPLTNSTTTTLPAPTTVTTTVVVTKLPQRTPDPFLAQKIAIPAGIIFVILLVIVILLAVLRNRRKYRGRSRFDADGPLYAPRSPKLMPEETDTTDDTNGQFNDLFESEVIDSPNQEFPNVERPASKAAPPVYTLPPPFPHNKTRQSDQAFDLP